MVLKFVFMFLLLANSSLNFVTILMDFAIILINIELLLKTLAKNLLKFAMVLLDSVSFVLDIEML